MSFVIVVFLISPTVFVKGSGSPISPRKFDEFGDINCEDEMARLDNFAIALQQAPETKGVIIFYGGQSFRGRLPRRGDAAARAARIKPYLVNRRGISPSRIVVIDGGFLQQWNAELWILPKELSLVGFRPTTGLSHDLIKFRKGKVRARDYRCQI